MRRLVLLANAMVLTITALGAPAQAAQAWFEKLKAEATPEQLYTFLYALPKGGDLHNHLSGGVLSEWLWDATLAQADKGYTYYTKVRIENCENYGTNEFGMAPYLLLFRNLQASNYDKLDACEKREYKRLQDLSPREKAGWLDSIRLDQPYEGRNEFFGAHWQRLNDVSNNPYIWADMMVRDMQAFGAEGLHVTHHHVGPDVRIVGYVVEALPVRAEEFVAALVGLVQADAVEPAGLLARAEILQALVLALLAGIELVVVGGLQIAEQQQVGCHAELVGAVVLAVLDAHLGVVGVALVGLRQRGVP